MIQVYYRKSKYINVSTFLRRITLESRSRGYFWIERALNHNKYARESIRKKGLVRGNFSSRVTEINIDLIKDYVECNKNFTKKEEGHKICIVISSIKGIKGRISHSCSLIEFCGKDLPKEFKEFRVTFNDDLSLVIIYPNETIYGTENQVLMQLKCLESQMVNLIFSTRIMSGKRMIDYTSKSKIDHYAFNFKNPNRIWYNGTNLICDDSYGKAQTEFKGKFNRILAYIYRDKLGSPVIYSVQDAINLDKKLTEMMQT